MPPLLPNRKTALLLQVLLLLMSILEVVYLGANIMRLNLIYLTDTATTVPFDGRNDNDKLLLSIALIMLIAFTATAITFIAWFYRAYCNMQLFRKGVLSPQWAIISWFIPLLNLYRPRQIMKALYDNTHSYLQRRGVSSKLLSTSGFISWWCFFWIAAMLIVGTDILLGIKAQSMIELIIATLISNLSAIITLIASLSAIVVVSDYSRMEQELYAIGINDDHVLTDLSNHLIQ